MIRRFQDILVETVKKEIKALTPGDIAFLKARSSYLNGEQLEKYASVLKLKPKAKPKAKQVTKK